MDADAELYMDHPLLRLRDRGQSLVLRFPLDRSFGEIQVDQADRPLGATRIFAAGPVERTLQAIGFRPIFRMVTLRQLYSVAGLSAQVLHIEPLGWYFELEDGDAALVESLERRLGLDRFSRETASYGDLARATGRGLERRRVERRRVERRTAEGAAPKAERRSSVDRRVAPRRRLRPTSVPS